MYDALLPGARVGGELAAREVTFMIGLVAAVIATPMVSLVAGQWIVNIVIMPFVLKHIMAERET